jgi:hypothetical protein
VITDNDGNAITSGTRANLAAIDALPAGDVVLDGDDFGDVYAISADRATAAPLGRVATALVGSEPVDTRSFHLAKAVQAEARAVAEQDDSVPHVIEEGPPGLAPKSVAILLAVVVATIGAVALLWGPRTASPTEPPVGASDDGPNAPAGESRR